MNNLDKYKQDYLQNGFISPVKIILDQWAKKHRDVLENTEKVLNSFYRWQKIKVSGINFRTMLSFYIPFFIYASACQA